MCSPSSSIICVATTAIVCHVTSIAPLPLGRIRLGEEDCVSKKGKCLPGVSVVGAWEIRLLIKLRCAVQDLALDRVPASEPEDER